jgi:hypothetical protein
MVSVVTSKAFVYTVYINCFLFVLYIIIYLVRSVTVAIPNLSLAVFCYISIYTVFKTLYCGGIEGVLSKCTIVGRIRARAYRRWW